LPRPGHWMVWLKRALAGLLIITMIWLGWLLFTVQGGTAAVLVLLLLILLLAAILFRIKLMMLGASLGLFLGLMFLPAPAAVKQQMAGIDWQQWSPAASAVAREQGKLVLVDVTADWCITCKANKTLVLEAAPIGPLLRTLANEDKLVMLKADWTRPDPAIASFLASHGRFGIPFNIIYGPKANDGIVLGELLNANMVESALIKAGMAR
jgi:suppressor for copper-sensitivity B